MELTLPESLTPAETEKLLQLALEFPEKQEEVRSKLIDGNLRRAATVALNLAKPYQKNDLLSVSFIATIRGVDSILARKITGEHASKSLSSFIVGSIKTAKEKFDVVPCSRWSKISGFNFSCESIDSSENKNQLYARIAEKGYSDPSKIAEIRELIALSSANEFQEIILILLLDGLTNEQIAIQLRTTVWIVRCERKKIKELFLKVFK